MSDFFLKTQGLKKNFNHVQALNDVSIKVRRGEVHAIVGENGAGKSTLVNILAGVLQPDEGKILLEGKEAIFSSPRDAKAHGIELIPQELNVVGNFNVVENIFLGSEPVNGPVGRMDFSEMRSGTQAILNTMGVNINLKTPVKKLSIARQQIVSIAKALHQKASIIIMDEPTSSISYKEIESLFEIINKLRKEKVTILYISHKLEEIFRISDSITVLRNGKKVGDYKTGAVNEDVLISKMVGSGIKEKYPKEDVEFGEVLFSISNISRKKVINNISFEVKKGEILGIFGLVGAGRTELLRILFGVDQKDEGEIFIEGREVEINGPEEAIRNKMALIPEDRCGKGLIMNMKIRENSSLVELERFCKYGVVNHRKETNGVKKICENLKIRYREIEDKISTLSGGNQQKIVLSKWLMGNPQIILLDEATRGIDVPSKVEIFNLVKEMVKNKAAVIFVSSEISEIMAIADRILIMHEGEQTVILNRHEFSAEKIILYATGGKTKCL